MTAFRNRLLGLAAGTLALSCISSMAYAQTTQEVLNFTGSVFHTNASQLFNSRSYFTLNQSMILNNIGFVYDSSSASHEFSYQIGSLNSSGAFISTYSSGLLGVGLLDPVTDSGLRYLTSFTAKEYASGTTFRIYNAYGETAEYTRSGFLDNAVGVTHFNPAGSTFATGNLRVTALGGSVAPEPGSFALALTGGAALLGICIRRRRNAA